MNRYKPYPAYRTSGVEWLGQLPEHWFVLPVKFRYEARLGKMVQPNPISDTDVLVHYHRAQTVQWENIDNSSVEEMWASPADINKFSISIGDLLICEGGDVCRGAIVDDMPWSNLIFQNSIHRVRSHGEYGVDWVLRLMQHVRSSGWIDVLCNKNTIVHFTSEKLGSLTCPLPPPNEQRAISKKLSRETTRIDSLIAKKTRFIELLKEKRQALITHAVTKGLDPNVKMKDSGVEWIGEVPENWDVAPFKRWFSTCSGGTPDTSKQDLYYTKSGGIPWLRTTDLTNGPVTAYEIGITEQALQDSACRLVPKDSVLVAMYGGDGTIGKNGILKFQSSINQALCALLPCTAFDPDFTFYYIVFYREHWMVDAVSTRKDPNISQDLIRSAPVVHPPLNEQINIVDHIKLGCDRIDFLVNKTQRSIDLLKERRSAFITAAVTGQIDLREAT